MEPPSPHRSNPTLPSILAGDSWDGSMRQGGPIPCPLLLGSGPQLAGGEEWSLLPWGPNPAPPNIPAWVAGMGPRGEGAYPILHALAMQQVGAPSLIAPELGAGVGRVIWQLFGRLLEHPHLLAWAGSGCLQPPLLTEQTNVCRVKGGSNS